MHIESERAAITSFAGNDNLNAEIKICDDDGKTVFIHVHYGYDGINQFSAGYTSIFDYATGAAEDLEQETVEYIEVFEELEETVNSKYAKFYKIGERMIDDIADSIKESSK